MPLQKQLNPRISDISVESHIKRSILCNILVAVLRRSVTNRAKRLNQSIAPHRRGT